MPPNCIPEGPALKSCSRITSGWTWTMDRKVRGSTSTLLLPTGIQMATPASTIIHCSPATTIRWCELEYSRISKHLQFSGARAHQAILKTEYSSTVNVPALGIFWIPAEPAARVVIS
ncbi:hypothetical protein M758_6G153800 [Ceratodon purpureus]|nr:hypothetical protein M758_6G153800 [Ceratodon purpureus]